MAVTKLSHCVLVYGSEHRRDNRTVGSLKTLKNGNGSTNHTAGGCTDFISVTVEEDTLSQLSWKCLLMCLKTFSANLRRDMAIGRKNVEEHVIMYQIVIHPFLKQLCCAFLDVWALALDKLIYPVEGEKAGEKSETEGASKQWREIQLVLAVCLAASDSVFYLLFARDIVDAILLEPHSTFAEIHVTLNKFLHLVYQTFAYATFLERMIANSKQWLLSFPLLRDRNPWDFAMSGESSARVDVVENIPSRLRYSAVRSLVVIAEKEDPYLLDKLVDHKLVFIMEAILVAAAEIIDRNISVGNLKSILVLELVRLIGTKNIYSKDQATLSESDEIILAHGEKHFLRNYFRIVC